VSDHFDLPSVDLDDDRERQEHAHELATYIKAHPAPNHALRARVAVLSHVGEDELDRLLPAVEQWLEQFDWQAESNS
jgi:hypothetical protein